MRRVRLCSPSAELHLSALWALKNLVHPGDQSTPFCHLRRRPLLTRWEVVLESRDADIAPSLLPISPTATRGAKRPSSRTNSSCPRPAARPSMPPQTRAAQCLVNVLAQGVVQPPPWD
jgi:hypothetical protein